MQRMKMFVFGALLAVSASTGAATNAGCCYPGSKLYLDPAGNVVGYQMIGCGDDAAHGTVTKKFRWIPGCVA